MLLKIVSGLTLDSQASFLYTALQSAKHWGLLLKGKRQTGSAATMTMLRKEQAALASFRRWVWPEITKGQQPTSLGVSKLWLQL